MTHCESCDSPPYFQYLLVPTNHPICKAMLINQVLVDSVLRTNYLIIILTFNIIVIYKTSSQWTRGVRYIYWLKLVVKLATLYNRFVYLMEMFRLAVSLCTKYYIFKGYIAIYNLVIIIEVVIKNI
jgi:hypothetical protein